MYITLTDLQGGGGSPSTPNYLFLTKNVRIRLPDAIYEFSLSRKCQPDSGYTSSLKAYSMLDFQNYKKNWLKQMESVVLIPVFQDMFRINRCKLQIIPNRESVLEDFKKIIHFNQLIGPVRITYNIC